MCVNILMINLRQPTVSQFQVFKAKTISQKVVIIVFCFFSFSCHFFVEPRSLYQGPVDGTLTSSSSDDRPCPELDASFPSHLTFAWFTGFAWTGFKRSLTAGSYFILFSTSWWRPLISQPRQVLRIKESIVTV